MYSKGFIQHLPSIRGDIHGVRIHSDVLFHYCFVDRVLRLNIASSKAVVGQWKNEIQVLLLNLGTFFNTNHLSYRVEHITLHCSVCNSVRY